MEKIKTFLVTAFIGGLVVLLPVAVLFKIFIWIFQWLAGLIAPVTGLMIATTSVSEALAQGLAFLSVVLTCFFVGLLVRTAWGSWAHKHLEYWILARIPGYKTLKELFLKLQPAQGQTFSKPVLFSLEKSGNELLGFITEEYGNGRYAVFIPTSPSPMNGFVVQTTEEHIRFVNVSADAMMKTVIACGVGSELIIKNSEPLS